MTFIDPVTGEWTPKNSDGYSQREYTLREALGRSINTIAASLIMDLGGGDETGRKGSKLVVERAKDFGVTTPLNPVASICLGTSDVKLFDMIGAYGVFANRGTWTEPIYLLRIEDKDGKVLQDFVANTREVLTEEEAYIMTHMLQAPVLPGGTAGRIRRYDFAKGPKTEVCGKTGTTSNYSDAWFMGFTKDLVAGVWSGADDRSVHFRLIKYGQGGRQAMPAFALYMDKVYKDKQLCDRMGYSKGPFPKPAQELSINIDCEEVGRAIDESAPKDGSMLSTEDEDQYK
jgi:penicillin-binding protein 1A